MKTKTNNEPKTQQPCLSQVSGALQSSHDKMQLLYNKLKGRKVSTDNFEAVVCGFHFKWDDSDGESIIVAIIKNKNGLLNGIRYRLNGDVVKEHGNLGYDYISVVDLSKYGLK